MATAREKLEEFRRLKKEEKEAEEANQKADIITSQQRNAPKPVAKPWYAPETETEPSYEEETPKSWMFTIILIVLYIIGQVFAYWTDFGAVFLIFSLIVAIYLNTGRRNKGELSAYSVFNADCERLPGQMTAEHFERDMLRQRRN